MPYFVIDKDKLLIEKGKANKHIKLDHDVVSSCREIVSNHVACTPLIIKNKDLTMLLGILYITNFNIGNRLCMKLNNTIKKIEIDFKKNTEVFNITDNTVVKKGQHKPTVLLLSIEKRWFSTPELLSIFLLIIKYICRRNHRIPLAGCTFEELVKKALSDKYINSIERESFEKLNRYGHELVKYIRELREKTSMRLNYNVPFGYGFIEFMKQQDKELSKKWKNLK